MTKPKSYKYKSKATAAAALGTTEAVLTVIGRAAYAVYEEIGYDLAEANGGYPIRRNALIEVCLDAGRSEQFLRRELDRFARLGRNVSDIQAAIAVLADSQRCEKLEAALKLYFPDAYYE